MIAHLRAKAALGDKIKVKRELEQKMAKIEF